MADLNLEAAPFLGGYARDFGTVQLREETGLYLRSIAIPLGGEKAAAAAVKKALGVDLPAAGASVTGKARVLATAADQYLDHRNVVTRPQPRFPWRDRPDLPSRNGQFS